MTTPDLVQELLRIPAAMDEAKARKRENWPVKANRASELGHPCLRYLVYLRTAWQQRSLPSVGLQYLFDERRRQEDHAVEDLREAGYTFIQQQRPFAWEKYDITGKIDGQLVLPRGAERGTLVPTDIKNINTWDWDAIAPAGGLQQFLDHKWVTMRKIPAQITAYLLMNNADLGAIVARNASNGRPKVVPVVLDWQIGEKVLRAAEEVNRHVTAGTLPDRIPYTQEVCGRCPFFHICLPDEALRQAVDLLDNEDLERRLARREEIKTTRDEYERLDREIKEQVKTVLPPEHQAIVGTSWLLRTVPRHRKGYNVSETDYVEVQIERLGKPQQEDA